MELNEKPFSAVGASLAGSLLGGNDPNGFFAAGLQRCKPSILAVSLPNCATPGAIQSDVSLKYWPAQSLPLEGEGADPAR
jgi:hypothetical protein